MIDVLPALHFIRPSWLWALLALPLLVWWWRARRRRDSVWRGVVDPHLLPHLLEAAPDLRTRGAVLAGALGYALTVLALAGPAWRQSEHPLWQSKAPLVIVLDLSSTAMASDLPPSRLLQARAKVATLLRERAGGQVGLVAYAGDAFTVAPLTDDAGNVALFLDALTPDVMPVDGQRADRAIPWSVRLLQQAGFDRGDIVLLTDHADADARTAATAAARSGYRVSALGVGSEAGAAYRDRDGHIGRAQLDAGSLRALVASGEGRYATLAPNDADLRALGVLDPQQADTASARGTTGQSWQDEGYWLLPPLLLLGLLVFRRGGGAMAALLAFALLPMLPVQAQTQAQAKMEPGTLWRRPDQLAHARMEQGTEAYRKNDFDHAAQAWTGLGNADAHYNRGNALAKQGKYPEAIAAYDDALQAQPGMADALANKRAVEAAMKRKPPRGKQQDNRGQQDQQQQSQGGQPSPQSGALSQQSKSGQSESQPKQSAQSRGDQQQSPRSQPAQQQPAKPADAEAQRAADAAQRERMQRALAQGRAREGNAGERARSQARAETPAERERRLATEAWLKRIPDDPGGLLRAKFRLEYERRQRQGAD